MEANTLNMKPEFAKATLHHVPISGRHLTAAKYIYIHDGSMTCPFDFPVNGGERSEISCCKSLQEVGSHISLVEFNFI